MGGSGIEPFVKLLDGGEAGSSVPSYLGLLASSDFTGWRILLRHEGLSSAPNPNERPSEALVEDYFYYSQIRSQDENTTKACNSQQHASTSRQAFPSQIPTA